MDYFEKNALFPPLISEKPAENLALVVTIPCHDEPDLLRTLGSILKCEIPKNAATEVIVVINSSEIADENLKKRNAATFEISKTWAAENSKPDLKFHILHCPNLPKKHAGVGLARKIAMDEAARRFEEIKNPRGVIVCLDADSQVKTNYLQAVFDFFEKNMACPAASIYYEHPLDGPGFSPEIYGAITKYELHLRYYVHALRRAGLPTATQTVGSAMAVRSNFYRSQGGMNRRQAGEDFYFLHKFTPLAGFGQITATTVVPSPRVSHRVPFGTGKAVGEILEGKKIETYSPLIFNDLNFFLDCGRWTADGGQAALDSLPPSISTFLKKENFPEKLLEIQSNTATPDAFRKRFFRWFDPFLAMKFVHWARDHFHPNVGIEIAAAQFLGLPPGKPARELLLIFRDLDKKT